MSTLRIVLRNYADFENALAEEARLFEAQSSRNEDRTRSPSAFTSSTNPPSPKAAFATAASISPCS